MSNTERDERLLSNIVELEQLGKEEEPEALIIVGDIRSLLDENRRLREAAKTALNALRSLRAGEYRNRQAEADKQLVEALKEPAP